MPSKKLTPEEKQKQAIEKQKQAKEKKEILNRLYKRITSDPLYSEAILEEEEFKRASIYDTPKTIMEKVDKGILDLSQGIDELKYWLKIFLIIADRTLRRKLVDNWDVVNKSSDDLETDFEDRGLVLKF